MKKIAVTLTMVLLLNISNTGLSPSLAGLSIPFFYTFAIPYRGPTTPMSMPMGLGSSAFARRYLRNHICFFFLRVLRCFTSPRSPSTTYVFSCE